MSSFAQNRKDLETQAGQPIQANVSRYRGISERPSDAIMTANGLATALIAERGEPRPGSAPGTAATNLVIGMNFDWEGQPVVYESLREAQRRVDPATQPTAYGPMEGLKPTCDLLQEYIFGGLYPERIATLLTSGGTGALYIAARYHFECFKTDRRGQFSNQILVPSPAWANHASRFESDGLPCDAGVFAQAGLIPVPVCTYDQNTHSRDLGKLLEAMRALPQGAAVCLQAGCDNPTGIDFNNHEIDEIVNLLANKRPDLVPIVDFAYMNLGRGPGHDEYMVRKMAQEGVEFFLAHSCSKFTSGYGLVRLGSLSVVVNDSNPQTLKSLRTQLVDGIQRETTSAPATYPAMVIRELFADKSLVRQLEAAHAIDRQRFSDLRLMFIHAADERAIQRDFGWLRAVNGMFSLFLFTPRQDHMLQDKFGCVMPLVEDMPTHGLIARRMAWPRLNRHNFDYCMDSFANTLLVK